MLISTGKCLFMLDLENSSMPKKSNQSDVSFRIHYIDVFRGLLMLMVILGHSIGNTNDPVNRFILSFHMPAFFILSGMCFKPKNYYNICEVLRRKGRGLLWPYLILSFVGVALYWLLLDGTPKGHNVTISQSLIGIVWPDGYVGRIVTNGFWFVYDLIWITLLYVITGRIRRFVRLSMSVALFLFLYYGNLKFYFSFEIMRVCAGFMLFVMGDLFSIFMQKYHIIENYRIAHGRGKTLLVAAICLSMNALVCNIPPPY